MALCNSGQPCHRYLSCWDVASGLAWCCWWLLELLAPAQHALLLDAATPLPALPAVTMALPPGPPQQFPLDFILFVELAKSELFLWRDGCCRNERDGVIDAWCCWWWWRWWWWSMTVDGVIDTGELVWFSLGNESRMSSIRSRFCTLCSGDTVADDDFGLPCSRHVFMLKVSKFLYIRLWVFYSLNAILSYTELTSRIYLKCDGLRVRQDRMRLALLLEATVVFDPSIPARCRYAS